VTSFINKKPGIFYLRAWCSLFYYVVKVYLPSEDTPNPLHSSATMMVSTRLVIPLLKPILN
jgi:hypothetical protein